MTATERPPTEPRSSGSPAALDLGRRAKRNLTVAELYEYAIERGEGHARSGRSAGGPHRQAHRPFAQGQVHSSTSRRAATASGGAASTSRSRKHASRPCERASSDHLVGAQPFLAGPVRRRRPRPTGGRCASTPRPRGRASSPATCSSGPTAEELAAYAPDFHIVDAPSFRADPERDGTRSETVILVHYGRRRS